MLDFCPTFDADLHGIYPDFTTCVGSISAGTANFTATTPVFSDDDAGDLIEVRGAGISGRVLITSITAVLSPTQVTLATNAATTATNRPAAFGKDQTAAIQAMLDTAGTVAQRQNKFATVFSFRPGVYVISQPLLVQQYHVKLQGNFAGLRMYGNDYAIRVDHANNVNNVIGVGISDFYINSVGGGIEACSAPQVEILNNHIKDFLIESGNPGSLGCGGRGIVVLGCVANKVVGNKIDGSGSQGIYVAAYHKTFSGGGSVVGESQWSIIRDNRIYCTGSIAVLVSEGGGHLVEANDIENCAGGIEIRSSYDYTVTDNYFEANGSDIQVRNLTHLVPGRTIRGGLIADNFCESTYGIILHGGNNQIVERNRISGNAVIGAATNTWWGRQRVLSGSFSDGGTGTKRADLFN